MTIELKNLIPLPLVEIDTGDSEIWEAESVVFQPEDKILLYAPSGTGKTSLLSIIYGLRNDYTGDVFFTGTNLKLIKLSRLFKLRKRNVSFVFQGLELFEELTAFENIELKNRQTGFKNQDEINSMADALEVLPFLNRKAGILSFGQRQRVAIIRALCQPFDWFLADEIFSHLDRDLTEKASELINTELKKQKAGILFTSLEKIENPLFNKKYRV